MLLHLHICSNMEQHSMQRQRTSIKAGAISAKTAQTCCLYQVSLSSSNLSATELEPAFLAVKRCITCIEVKLA